jgi:hypothetical protein
MGEKKYLFHEGLQQNGLQTGMQDYLWKLP